MDQQIKKSDSRSDDDQQVLIINEHGIPMLMRVETRHISSMEKVIEMFSRWQVEVE
jgi:hypothetical protein